MTEVILFDLIVIFVLQCQNAVDLVAVFNNENGLSTPSNPEQTQSSPYTSFIVPTRKTPTRTWTDAREYCQNNW